MPAGWRRMRAAALYRDGFLCQRCFRASGESLEVHHMKGPDDHALEHLLTLCRGCHIREHKGREQRGTPGRAEWIRYVSKLMLESP